VRMPRFDETVRAIIGRFRAAVVPDIARPRVEAERLREIALAHATVAHGAGSDVSRPPIPI